MDRAISSLGMWRHPKTKFTKDNWAWPELYQHIAKTCERGLFDMVFFADLNYISDTFKGLLGAGPALRGASARARSSRPARLARRGDETYRPRRHLLDKQPTSVLRRADVGHAGSPDQRPGAWNVVTSINRNQQANYGTERADADTRYDQAHEYMEVCRKLWDSWDEDAVVMDKEGAVFDASKVRRIEHEGHFFKSRGPLNVVRSPQNGPAILQAGTSPKGMDFAAKYADGIFAIQPRAENAAEYFAQVKGRMEKIGRNPDHCRILFGAQPIIGESEAHAVELQEEHNELVPLDAGMTILSAHLDFDLSQIPLDADMTERTEPELHRMRTRFLNRTAAA